MPGWLGQSSPVRLSVIVFAAESGQAEPCRQLCMWREFYEWGHFPDEACCLFWLLKALRTKRSKTSNSIQTRARLQVQSYYCLFSGGRRSLQVDGALLRCTLTMLQCWVKTFLSPGQEHSVPFSLWLVRVWRLLAFCLPGSSWFK